MSMLLQHVFAGAGGQRAAEALADALQTQDEHARFAVCDILDFTPQVFRESRAHGRLRRPGGALCICRGPRCLATSFTNLAG
jgi:hypothetical protein